MLKRLVSTAVTVLGYVLFMGALIAIVTQWFAQTMRRLESGPSLTGIVVELMDPENTKLLVRDRAETLVSPRVISHMLAQVALRPELRRVFDELFGPGGAEIFFQPAVEYGLSGGVRFEQVQTAAMLKGETALGLRLGGGAVSQPRSRTRMGIGTG